jgi:DNA-binding NtrC family response regulator
MDRVLVIEDDAAVRSNVMDLLEAEGFCGLAAESGERGVELAVQQLPDLIICDVSMPGMDGYGVFELLSAQAHTASIPFIFLSARAERADVRRGMALGAADYLTKPFTRRELLDTIRTRLRRHRSSAPAPTGNAPARPLMLAPQMVELDKQLSRVASASIAVLILGETGVGKEVVAEQIHSRSGRKGRFVAIHCAALSESLLESELFGYEKGAFTGADRAREGLFEAAQGGTVFLDEVGELPQSTQVKLLRVLEERKVMPVGGRTARALDVRFVAATHRDLEEAVAAGSFRQDLYYRLNGITLHVPALRDRSADVVLLARYFIEVSCRTLGRARAPQLSEAVLDALVGYAWPGNIRELRNVIERAVLLGDDELLPAHLPQKLLQTSVGHSTAPQARAPDPRAALREQMEQVERERIIAALRACDGNQTLAAERLGISRRTLVSRLAHFDLPRPRKARERAGD